LSVVRWVAFVAFVELPSCRWSVSSDVSVVIWAVQIPRREVYNILRGEITWDPPPHNVASGQRRRLTHCMGGWGVKGMEVSKRSGCGDTKSRVHDGSSKCCTCGETKSRVHDGIAKCSTRGCPRLQHLMKVPRRNRAFMMAERNVLHVGVSACRISRRCQDAIARS